MELGGDGSVPRGRSQPHRIVCEKGIDTGTLGFGRNRRGREREDPEWWM